MASVYDYMDFNILSVCIGTIYGIMFSPRIRPTTLMYYNIIIYKIMRVAG